MFGLTNPVSKSTKRIAKISDGGKQIVAWLAVDFWGTQPVETFARYTIKLAHAYPKITNTQNVNNLLIMHFRNCIIKKRASPIITR